MDLVISGLWLVSLALPKLPLDLEGGCHVGCSQKELDYSLFSHKKSIHFNKKGFVFHIISENKSNIGAISYILSYIHYFLDYFHYLCFHL